MKLKKVILDFVMLLTIVGLGTGIMGCKASASSASSVYSALKKEKGLTDAKQWMVIKENKHDYLVLANQTSAEQFRKDKAEFVNEYSKCGFPSIPYSVPASSDYNMFHVTDKNGDLHIKAVNIDPQDTGFFGDYKKIANSVQIYNTLKRVAKTIK